MSITIAEAKANFAAVIRRAESGEAITLTRHGRPVARIIAVAGEPARPLIGALKGQIMIADDFDAPLTDFDRAVGAPVDPS